MEIFLVALRHSLSRVSLAVLAALNKFLLLHLMQQSKKGLLEELNLYLSSFRSTISGFHLPFLYSVGFLDCLGAFAFFSFLTFYSLPPASFLFFWTLSDPSSSLLLSSSILDPSSS
jgi:hypothetical protein